LTLLLAPLPHRVTGTFYEPTPHHGASDLVLLVLSPYATYVPSRMLPSLDVSLVYEPLQLPRRLIMATCSIFVQACIQLFTQTFVCSLYPTCLANAFLRMLSLKVSSKIQDFNFPAGSFLSFFLSNSLAASQSSSIISSPTLAPRLGQIEIRNFVLFLTHFYAPFLILSLVCLSPVCGRCHNKESSAHSW
jgi:hypothetical protein